MFAQVFSKYLVDQKVMEDSKRTEILGKLAGARTKMGTIAVAEKLLTEDQAEELNQLQMQMDRRFGDLAVEKGYLKEEDVTAILKKQGNPYILFVQLAEEVAGISLATCEEKLAEFQKAQGWSAEEIEALKNDDIDKLIPVLAPCPNAHVVNLTSLALRCMVRFVSGNFYVERLKKTTELSYEKLAGQRMEGANSIFVGFASGKGSNGLNLMADRYAKEDFAADSDDVYDAVGEFTNCLNGLYASDLSDKDIEIDMEPPVAYEAGTLTGTFYVMPICVEEEELYLVVSADTEVNMSSEALKLQVEKRAANEQLEAGKKSVLIVDDSRMSRKVLRDVLEKNGYQVVGEAVDGVEGVSEFERLKPDIVTLDVTMPNMDGIEALGKIIEADANATVIMISAAGQQKRIIEALKIGAKKFITKPFDPEDIVKNFKEL